MNSIDTSRFGKLDYRDEDIIKFPKGIPGFEDKTNWVVTGEADEDIKWLQSIDEGTLALAVSHPRCIDPEYNISVARHDLEAIDSNSLETVGILAVLTIPADAPWEARANLRAPILVNSEARLGRQVIALDEKYPVQAHIFNEEVRAKLKEESLVKNAGEK